MKLSTLVTVSLLFLATVVHASTGVVTLTDSTGLEFFINEEITFNTTSNASGAASEASYTQAVQASTANGGLTSSVLNDMYDGYGSIYVNGVSYNQNGNGVLDCNGRVLVLNPQNINDLTVSREVYVPTDDAFIRWTNIVTNTNTTTPVDVDLQTANNLGSDSMTRIMAQTFPATDPNDPNTVPAVDPNTQWVVTMQWFGTSSTTSDPRIGHVLQGPGATAQITSVFFANGSDNPNWTYHFTLQPNTTARIITFSTGQPTVAKAAQQAAALVQLPATALECMTTDEEAQVLNFHIAQDQQTGGTTTGGSTTGGTTTDGSTTGGTTTGGSTTGGTTTGTTAGGTTGSKGGGGGSCAETDTSFMALCAVFSAAMLLRQRKFAK